MKRQNRQGKIHRSRDIRYQYSNDIRSTGTITLVDRRLQWTFGVYNADLVTADPIANRAEYARQAIENSVARNWVTLTQRANQTVSNSIVVPARHRSWLLSSTESNDVRIFG